jgi:hypothetical protein
MKIKGKQTRSARPAKAEPRESGVFVVPSHGRLARRGSTEIIVEEEEQETPRGLRDLQSHVS